MLDIYYLYHDHARNFYFKNNPAYHLYCERDGLSDVLIAKSNDIEELIINNIVPIIVSENISDKELYNNWPYESYMFKQNKYSSARVYIGLNLMVAKRISVANALKDKILYLSDKQADEVVNDLGLKVEDTRF